MWKVVLYIAFFAILFSSASVIDVIKYDGISESYRESIKQDMTIVNEDCAIVNSRLICDSEYKILVYEQTLISFYIDSHVELDYGRYEEAGYAIIIHEDHIYFSYKGIEAYSYLINDLDSKAHNIDFNDQLNDPDLFYNSIFDSLDELLVEYKVAWGSIIIFFEILISFVVYMMFIMLSSYFLRRRFKVVPFKQLFAMTAYSSTALFVILIFDSILELNIILIVLLIIVAFRQNSALSNEIARRLKNKS